MLFRPKALALALTQRHESTPAVYRLLLAAMRISPIRISVPLQTVVTLIYLKL